MRRIAVVVVMVLLAASCGDDAGPSLTGTWTGTEVAGDEVGWTFVFDETDASATSDGTELYRATYVAYPDEDPMRMEYTIIESMFPPFVGEVAHTIYRLDGATLVLASTEPGVETRPTGFEPGGGTRVWELTRQ